MVIMPFRKLKVALTVLSSTKKAVQRNFSGSLRRQARSNPRVLPSCCFFKYSISVALHNLIHGACGRLVSVL
jgi:hypothetical protein